MRQGVAAVIIHKQQPCALSMLDKASLKPCHNSRSTCMQLRRPSAQSTLLEPAHDMSALTKVHHCPKYLPPRIDTREENIQVSRKWNAASTPQLHASIQENELPLLPVRLFPLKYRPFRATSLPSSRGIGPARKTKPEVGRIGYQRRAEYLLFGILHGGSP